MYTKPFVLAALANFLFYSNVNAYTLLPLYIQTLGGGEGQIGAIMAMYSVAAILCQASLGAFLDRWSRKPVILVAAGTLTLVSITFTFTRNLTWYFYLLRFLQGGAVAIFLTSNLTLIADLAPPSRRAEAVGIFGVSGLVSIALAPAIGEAILRAWGFRALFAATVLVAVAALAVCLSATIPAAVPVPASPGLGPSFWPTFFPILTAAFLSTWLLLLVALINGTSHGFLYPAASALAFDRAPSGGRGRTLAVFNIAALLGGATGAFGFGWLVEFVGYRPGFLLVGFLLATGAGAFWRKW